MSDTDARQRGVQLERHQHDDSGEMTPERHDSKVDSEQGAQKTRQELSDRMEKESREENERAVGQNGGLHLHPLDTQQEHQHPALAHRSSPASAGLHIQTDIAASSAHHAAPRVRETPAIFETPVTTDPSLYQVTTSQSFAGLGSSLRTVLSNSSIASSPGSASALPSPYLAGMPDLTPLPSPMVMSDAGSLPYRRSLSTSSRSRAGSLEDPKDLFRLFTSTSPPKRKKGYGSLLHDAVEGSRVQAASEDNPPASSEGNGHGRNRSISDFVPEQLQNVRHRQVTFGPGDGANLEAQEYRMQREPYVAPQRGLSIPDDSKRQKQLPSPPPSTSSKAESDEAEEEQPQPFLEDGTAAEYLSIHCGIQNKRRKFRQLRQLGQGTFSKVMLATRQRIPAHPTPELEDHLDPRQLVAIKIIQYGPAGGADEARIETGLKREVEMLKSISHPSLIHLKACEYQPARALLVLTYCPGGDLFDLASQNRGLLTPALTQRIFAELLSAVAYLHALYIVHRDIKLENVLVNLPLTTLASPTTHPTPLITLTDLGLSRRIPSPPESPLLTTRCGSEDYAAPEILLGQPYDGRATDAWALGVLLYALMEGRLPFDAPPGKPERSRNTHRIARCDWIWCRFGDDEGEWDDARPGAREFEGAREVVEGLLRKVRMGRWGVEVVGGRDWVREGIQVEGGLRAREEDEGEERLR